MTEKDEFERRLGSTLDDLEIAISQFEKLVEDCQWNDLYDLWERAQRARFCLGHAVDNLDPDHRPVAPV